MKRCALFLAAGVIALAAAPIVRQTFENGDEGWAAFGQNGDIRMTRELGDVKIGKGALAFDYDVSHGPAFAVWPVKEPIGEMKSLRFWLKTDSPSAIAVLLNEKPPGGHYMRIVWSLGNTWQRIELEPSDFTLNEGPNDPKDADNRLDPDQIQSVGLFDVSQMFSSAAQKAEVPIIIEAKSGKHTMFIDDFEISSEALPLSATPGEGVVIDDFPRPVLQWITLGGVSLAPENHGMRARYQQEEEKYAVITKMLPRLDLRGWNRLAFDIASDKPAQLVFSLEERNPGKGQGPRYSTTVDILGGGKIEHRAVVFSAFGLDPNGPADPDGQLDLDQVKTISILDITAASSHETVANSFWIGNVRTAEKKSQFTP